MQGLGGKAAIVTGGSRGVGSAVASRVAAEGVRVTLSARKGDALREAVTTTPSEHGEGCAMAMAGDGGDAEHRRDAVAATLEAFGSVDLASALHEGRKGREAEVSVSYPLERLGGAADVANAVASLFAESSRGTGQTLLLDGGVSLTGGA